MADQFDTFCMLSNPLPNTGQARGPRSYNTDQVRRRRLYNRGQPRRRRLYNTGQPRRPRPHNTGQSRRLQSPNADQAWGSDQSQSSVTTNRHPGSRGEVSEAHNHQRQPQDDAQGQPAFVNPLPFTGFEGQTGGNGNISSLTRSLSQAERDEFLERLNNSIQLNSKMVLYIDLIQEMYPDKQLISGASKVAKAEVKRLADLLEEMAVTFEIGSY